MIRKTFAFLAASMLATPALAAPIDGTWVADINSAQLSTKPKVRSLDHGVYRCSSCVPVFAIAADGKWHPIKGDPYVDEGMVKVADAHTVMFGYRQKGKSVNASTATISPDGKTINWTRKNTAANGVETNVEATDVRAAAGAKGAHLISGSWRNGKIAKMDAAALTVTFGQDKGMFRMSAPTGEHYEAKLGGPAVAVLGDPGGTKAAIRQTGPMTWVETDTRKGKLVSTFTIHLVNPTTANIVSVDHEVGTTTRYVAHKQ
ncbi:hypothetical protein [Sphingomonas sp.]|uniref:hypothetical protein n=1 Tax=Sphingomonas sp. TaxID=28214 RepID=UPI00286CF3D8|nr:hypothetical protein [Sphingomonas sp.]